MSAIDRDLSRLAELAVDRWLEGLEPPESIEFEMLRLRHPTFSIDSVEEAASALQVTLPRDCASLPERVRLELARGADDYFGPRPAAPDVATVGAGGREVAAGRPESWFAYGGWLTAAASVLVSVALWQQRPRPAESPGIPAPPPVSSAPHEETGHPVVAGSTRDKAPDSGRVAVTRTETEDAAAERAQFMNSHAWLMQRAWVPGPDPTGEAVTGDVVWDAKSQSGYLRFHRLRRNDPNVEQYQLWIVDARRDPRFPVDGGVFDIRNGTGDGVIKFTARLAVEVPVMFVVTVERRGGVVVSDRTRVAAVASST